MRENAVREAVAANDFVTVKHIEGKVNISDIFTKEEKNTDHFITTRDFILVDTVDEQYDTLEEKLEILNKEELEHKQNEAPAKVQERVLSGYRSTAREASIGLHELTHKVKAESNQKTII